MITIITDNDKLVLPELLTRRWQDVKTFIYSLSYGYNKFDLVKALLKDRESHTVAPNLSEITSFTGYDNAILSIMKWDWPIEKDNSTLDMDGFNMFITNGGVAGQAVFHVHLHVIPRFHGDGLRIRFPPGYPRLEDRSVLEEQADLIRTAMPRE